MYMNNRKIKYKYSLMAVLYLFGIVISSEAYSSETVQNVKVKDLPGTSTAVYTKKVPDTEISPTQDVPISLHLSRREGQWLVNNTRKPVIKTINNRMNYIILHNDSDHIIANILIPKLDYEVIAKNGVMLSTKCVVNGGDEATSSLWLEPFSALTIAFFNDLSSTPLQAIISKSSSATQLIAIFGPEKPKSFTLQVEAATEKTINKKLFKKEHNLNEPKITSELLDKTSQLVPNVTYTISNVFTPKMLKFSNPVYISKRNSKCAGSQYWAKSIVAYPNEEIHIVVNSRTLVD